MGGDLIRAPACGVHGDCGTPVSSLRHGLPPWIPTCRCTRSRARPRSPSNSPARTRGDGTTTAYPFFAEAPGFELVFRKRALHPGASIGVHRNDKDEIYYVLSGEGELTTGDRTRVIGPGTAVLTRAGGTPGLRQRGDEDLVIFILYRRPQDR